MNDGGEADTEDAVNEEEDPVDMGTLLQDNGCIRDDNQEESLPNNDFCFSEEDFLETAATNDAMRHQGAYRDAWATIKSLEGTSVEVPSQQGNLKWTVVQNVEEDEFKEVQEEENNFYLEYLGAHTANSESAKKYEKNSFADGFWELWPTNIKEEVKNQIRSSIKITKKGKRNT